nr:hypothetical protein [Mesorhizobium sp.]
MNNLFRRGSTPEAAAGRGSSFVQAKGFAAISIMIRRINNLETRLRKADIQAASTGEKAGYPRRILFPANHYFSLSAAAREGNTAEVARQPKP